jgi:hypothetical protein
VQYIVHFPFTLPIGLHYYHPKRGPLAHPLSTHSSRLPGEQCQTAKLLIFNLTTAANQKDTMSLSERRNPRNLYLRRSSLLSPRYASTCRRTTSINDTQAAVKKAAVSKKPLSTKKYAPNDSISEDDTPDFHSSPAKPPVTTKSGDDENLPGPSKTPAKAKSASDVYQKVRSNNFL